MGQGLGERPGWAVPVRAGPQPETTLPSGSAPALFAGCTLQEALQTTDLCTLDFFCGSICPASFSPWSLPLCKGRMPTREQRDE